MPASAARHIAAATQLGVSVFTCLEVARLVAGGKITVPGTDVTAWIRNGLAAPRVAEVAFTAEIAVEAYRLPSPFHKDPADRILVATARVLNIPLLTVDARILNYPHVTALA